VTADPPPVSVRGIVTRFGPKVVHDGVTFSVPRARVTALIGASGSGKSVLLREMVGLVRPTTGTVRMLGVDPWRDDAAAVAAMRRRIGVMFQDGALFSSLTVGENVAVPLTEHARVPAHLLPALVAFRLAQAGLDPDVARQMPGTLSGGMRKRAAIARALALEPEILFLDEPTSGLDPTTARGIDHLLRVLVDTLGMTVLVVTHDLDTLLGGVDRIVALSGGRVIADGDVAATLDSPDPWLRSYFAGRCVVPTGSG